MKRVERRKRVKKKIYAKKGGNVDRKLKNEENGRQNRRRNILK